LWWLGRRNGSLQSDSSVSTQWPLFATFVIWANCDEWFFLGPLIVGVFLLGSIFQGKQPAVRWQVFLLSLGVCLLNPHHVWVFSAPVSLLAGAASDTTSGLGQLLTLSWTNAPIPLAAYALLALLSLLA